MKVELPFLAEGIEGGDVVQLLVREGDQVSEGQSLIELETEKATVRKSLSGRSLSTESGIPGWPGRPGLPMGSRKNLSHTHPSRRCTSSYTRCSARLDMPMW